MNTAATNDSNTSSATHGLSRARSASDCDDSRTQRVRPAENESSASTVPDTKPAAIEAEIVPEPAKVEPKAVVKADPVEIAKTMTPYAEKEAPAPVPAENMFHLRLIDRWPQVRGEPWMHTAIRKLDSMEQYSTSELRAAQNDATGPATEIPGLMPSGATVSPEGKVSRSFQAAAPTDNEGVVFPNADAAEAAGFSAEGADVLPNGMIRVRKMARVDKSRSKFTEAEGKSILYLDRMKSAEIGRASCRERVSSPV